MIFPIEIHTEIAAPPERCFDLARDLDLHIRSMKHTHERIIGGKDSGLLDLHDEVIFQGCHFGLVFSHHARITHYEAGKYFRDEMVSGRFKRFVHDHLFEQVAAGTRMTDIVEFEMPWGNIGALVGRLVIKPYLTNLIAHRATVIKTEATAIRP